MASTDHSSPEIEMREPSWVRMAGNEAKAKKAKAMIVKQGKKAWMIINESGCLHLVGSGFGPVQNRFSHNPLAPNLELNHRSSSSLSMNLGPDHG